MISKHLSANRVLALFALLFSISASAQDDRIYGEVGAGVNFMDKDRVPFWQRANQYGSVPLPGTSASLYGRVHKDYDSIDRPLFDWGAAVEGRLNVGQKVQGILVEGYLKAAFSIFELKAGRVKQIIGLVDSTLSTGSFSMSGNALGIPKVEASIPEYFEIPILNGLFAFKGNFAYGWIGQAPVQYHYFGKINTSFNQSSFYGRLGQPDWRTHIYAGFNHEVFFGDEKTVFGNRFDLSKWQTFWDAALGKTWNYSKVGNHIGSIDFALQYDLNHASVFIYHQFFYDEGALAHLANLKDGLTGLSITNLNEPNSGHLISWHKVLFEFLASKDQAGYPWSKRTPSGDENYYNNYEYAEGYSYKQIGLGNALMSTRLETRNLPSKGNNFFINNRVLAVNLGVEGAVKDIKVTAKLTLSKNYGTFGTSEYGSSTGDIFSHNDLRFPESNQLSAYLALAKSIRKDLAVDLSIAVDKGQLLYNTGGLTLRVMKSF